jgi:hypothetical protein
MLQRLEELKRERRPNEASGRRAKEVGHGYGDVVYDTDALICLMRDLYRERLVSEGNTPAEADQIVAVRQNRRLSATPEHAEGRVVAILESPPQSPPVI